MTTTEAIATTVRVLASGALVLVDPQGRTSPFTCNWLVQVPTASLYPPEADWYPDSPADVYTLVECGAQVRALRDYPLVNGEPSATICDHGHDHLPLEVELAPFGPAWQREQAERNDGPGLPLDYIF